MNKLVIIASAVSLLAGCADSHKLVRYGEGKPHALSATDSVFIAVPRDGMYEARVYTGSGSNTSQIILAAFARRVRRVQTGHEYQEFDEAIKYAKNNSYTVLVYPTILSWEDRATEWSGIPDKVEVKIEVVTTSNGATVGSATVSGKSGLATFGGDHPQDLLPKTIEEFVSGLF